MGPQALTAEGKQVDKDAALAEDAVVIALVQERMAVAQFAEEVEIILVRVVGLQGHIVGKLLRQYLHQPQIITAQKAHVKVIVPGDEPIVTDGTQQCTAIEEIRDVVTTANLVEQVHQFQHPQLLAAQGGAVGIEPLA